MRFYGLEPSDYPRLFAEKYSRFRYSEAFWEMMGTDELVTLDGSDYEGATFIHDLNKPIPDEMKERFDAVCDVGTLEHVLDLPTALRNCLDMVALGGRVFIHTPANNFFGHGFYQFSPELFYRVLAADNGFEIERVVAVEYGPRHRWFKVADPLQIRARVALVNSFPVLLFVRARRIALVPILSRMPHQSDSIAQWTGEAAPAQKGEVDRLANARLNSLKRFLLERAPRISRILEALRFSSLNRDWSFRNKLSFSRLRGRRR